MKKITIITILMVLLVTSFSTAYAGNGPGGSSDKGKSGINGQDGSLCAEGVYGQGVGGCYGEDANGVQTQQGDTVRNRHQRVLFTLVGTITAVGDGGITVNVLAGNRLVKTYVGSELTIGTTEDTRILQKLEVGADWIDFSALAAEQVVSVQGTFVEGVWTALRITVGALTLRK